MTTTQLNATEGSFLTLRCITISEMLKWEADKVL